MFLLSKVFFEAKCASARQIYYIKCRDILAGVEVFDCKIFQFQWFLCSCVFTKFFFNFRAILEVWKHSMYNHIFLVNSVQGHSTTTYMDQNLPHFDPLPTSSEQLWIYYFLLRPLPPSCPCSYWMTPIS